MAVKSDLRSSCFKKFGKGVRQNGHSKNLFDKSLKQQSEQNEWLQGSNSGFFN